VLAGANHAAARLVLGKGRRYVLLGEGAKIVCSFVLAFSVVFVRQLQYPLYPHRRTRRCGLLGKGDELANVPTAISDGIQPVLLTVECVPCAIAALVQPHFLCSYGL